MIKRKIFRRERLGLLRKSLALLLSTIFLINARATSPITPQGAALGAFLDSFEVENYWNNGFQVNWLTGSTNAWTGGGQTDILPNMETVGDTTHCSAFVAGATLVLGVYILRPPQVLVSDLANHQQPWLFTNNAGWIYITDVSTNAVMLDAQNYANEGYIVVATYASPPGSSGHIVFIRPNDTRSDADIIANGPQECQAGDYNYNSTNVITGFSQHPGVFPNEIRYFYYPLTNSVSNANPVLNSVSAINGTVTCSVSSIVGRSYYVEWSTNGVNWTTSATYTNPNNQSNFMCLTNVSFPQPTTNGFEIMVAGPYGDQSQALGVNFCLVSVSLNGSATMSLPIGSTFLDPGVTASDTCPGQLTFKTNGTVNTAVIGTNVLTYTATDTNGNSGSATRTVYVTGVFNRLLTLAPGETATPGIAPGKSGAPVGQHVGFGYPIVIMAMDTNWNLVGSASDTVAISSSAPGDIMPTPVALGDGTATFIVTNDSAGNVTLTASDATDGTKLPGSSTVNISPRSNTITVLTCSPDPACAGEPITFTATVSGSNNPTGTVSFESGQSVLATTTLSGNTATFTTSGGVGNYSIKAVYSGDGTNDPSTSGAVTETITTNSVAVSTAQMTDGQDYPLATNTTSAGRAPWQIGSAGGTGATSYIKIIAGDLTGTTTPALKPLPNVVNPEAYLQVGTPGTTGRWYYRSIGSPITNGAAYFSFLLNVPENSTTTNEFRMTLIASSATNSPETSDPLSLHVREADGSHYNLGVERLNGTIAWASNALADNTDYLVVVKYAFGNSASSKLFINPIPGEGEPPGDAESFSDGITAEPVNIGTVLFFESAVAPVTSGVINCDVMRADTNWYNVTPAATGATSGAAALTLSPGSQTFDAEESSQLITVSVQDQNGNPFYVWSDTVVNLATTSGDGNFQDGSTLAIVGSVTIPAGGDSASFYYLDAAAGYPAITALSGLLASASQTETVLNNGQLVSPSLSIARSGTNVVLSWQVSDGGFGLQSSVSWSNWNEVSGSVTTNLGIVSKAVSPGQSSVFFRLRHQ
jgi:hypothetical protein